MCPRKCGPPSNPSYKRPSLLPEGEGVPISLALAIPEDAADWLAAAQTATPRWGDSVDGSLVFDLAVVLGLAAAVQFLPVLDHPTRRRIYEHLLRLPGDHFRSIVRSLDLGLGTARYHLAVLVDRGVVREEKHNGRCRYYPTGKRSEPERNDLYGRYWDLRDLRTRILSAALEQRDLGPTRISESLGISRQLARYHLRRLRELGDLLPSGTRPKTPR